VFQNLLSNALTYCGCESPEVHVSAERSRDAWQFAVADRGIGIDPDHQDRIFDVFERLHGGEDGAGENVRGIGLALCERIVERHGGDIWVDSTPGEGTTFYFTMPAAEERQPEPTS
jgi:signal transduction histidine kinase